MAFFDMFKPQEQAAQAQAQVQQPQQLTQAPQQQQPMQPQATEVNNTVPNATNTPQRIDPVTGQPVVSPLDNFSDIWKTNNQQGAQQQPGLQFNADPAKFMEAAQQINFSQVIPRDAMEKVLAGGEGGMNAFNDAINRVAQVTYAQSAHANTKILEAAMARMEEQLMGRIPDVVRRHSVNDSFKTDNPLYSHPAAAPIIGALEQQLTSNYPNASATEIKSMASKYLEALSSAITPKQQDSAVSEGPDWSALLGN